MVQFKTDFGNATLFQRVPNQNPRTDNEKLQKKAESMTFSEVLALAKASKEEKKATIGAGGGCSRAPSRYGQAAKDGILMTAEEAVLAKVWVSMMFNNMRVIRDFISGQSQSSNTELNNARSFLYRALEQKTSGDPCSNIWPLEDEALLKLAVREMEALSHHYMGVACEEYKNANTHKAKWSGIDHTSASSLKKIAQFTVQRFSSGTYKIYGSSIEVSEPVFNCYKSAGVSRR